jgi:formylglycine-generating enzyme required for sulfatase activity/DNA-binding winged helix-turn-helix (wHTH) protein
LERAVHIPRQLVRFGIFEVDLRSGELRKGHLKLKLTCQAFQVLAILLENPGELITREELQKRLWSSETYVDFEHGLNNAVNRIRAVLSDSTGSPRFIETLPKRGYRFIADVEGSAATNAAGWGRIQTTDITKPLSKPKLAIRTAIVIIAVILLGLILYRRSTKIHWARQQAIPEIIELIQKNNHAAAFALAEQAEQYIPHEPRLQRVWSDMSQPVTIHTAPEGADVYVKPYRKGGSWQYIGRSPIDRRRMPLQFSRWQIQKEGFENVEVGAGFYGAGFWRQSPALNFALFEKNKTPSGMVWVAGDTFSLSMPGMDGLPEVTLASYWIDKFEVTNREFKKFVAADGYTTQRFWREKFIKDGRELSWQEAMAAFRDRTGRPGPSTWRLGSYPDKQGDYPVTGVSWYEAAAYAEFVGKSLPTVYHWDEAAGTPATSEIAPVSNFEGKGLAMVGSYAGLGPYGTYDMAGNAKEWCWNASGRDKRYVLGGAWNEPAYMFTDPDAQSPFVRHAEYGFRLVRNTAPPPESARGGLVGSFRDFNREQPVSDEIFRAYQGLYAYNKTPLNAVLESEDDSSESWRMEKISFDAAYGKERITAYLFLPKNSSPPFHTLVYFPGSYAINMRSSPDLLMQWVDFLPRTGRALVYPVLQRHFRTRGRFEDRPPGTYRFLPGSRGCLVQRLG